MKASSVIGWLLVLALFFLVIGLADGAPGPWGTAARMVVSQVGAGMSTAGTWLQAAVAS